MIINNIRLLLRHDLTLAERKAIVLASLSCVVEFYDFIILGFMSVYFLDGISHQTYISNKIILLFFIVIFSGYLIKPLGMKLYTKIAPVQEVILVDGIITALIIVATCLIGLVPTSNLTLALVVLFVSRMVQGLASGAEMQANIDHLYIKLSPHNSSYAILGTVSGNEVGILLGIIINRLINALLTPMQMIDYGWRLAFLISALLSLAVFLLRSKYSQRIDETHCYRNIIPLYKLVQYYFWQVVIATIFSGVRGSATFIYLIIVPFLLYFSLHYSPLQISEILFTATMISAVSAFILNNQVLINHRIDYWIVPLLMAVCSILLIPAIVYLGYSFVLDNNSILTSVSLLGVLTGWLRLLAPRLVTGLFPAKKRLAGFNFSTNSGFILSSTLVVILNTGVAGIIHHFFSEIKFERLFFLSLISFTVLFAIITLICIFNLTKLINFKELNQLRRNLYKIN